MDIRLLNKLVCPITKSQLQLVTVDEEQHGDRRIVKTGLLHTQESGYWYPVINYVPVMLTFETPVVHQFAKTHTELLRAIPQHQGPSSPTLPGERQVQATFTEEWESMGQAPITFGYDHGELREIHRAWLYLPREGDTKSNTVLDVGCGYGQEAMVLAELFKGAEIIGMDLNLSLLSAADHLKTNPRIHLVIASLFRPPFRTASMDHVHCQGVIHHTYSTKAAFDSIAPLCHDAGSLFVWVYAKEDLLMRTGIVGTIRRNIRILNDLVTRQFLSRLPSTLRSAAIHLLAIPTHPILRRAAAHRDMWTIKNTKHVLRDAFTPPYIHRHGFNEMISWFEQHGFNQRAAPAGTIQAITGRRYRGVGVLGWRGNNSYTCK